LGVNQNPLLKFSMTQSFYSTNYSSLFLSNFDPGHSCTPDRVGNAAAADEADLGAYPSQLGFDGSVAKLATGLANHGAETVNIGIVANRPNLLIRGLEALAGGKNRKVSRHEQDARDSKPHDDGVFQVTLIAWQKNEGAHRRRTMEAV
ncbi:hypothetical protein CI238_03443, partial [Colletotrichum incanum]